MSSRRPISDVDVECLANYFLILFRDLATGLLTPFEVYEGHPLNAPILLRKLATVTARTFNGWRYDQVMIAAALTGYDNAQLKHISDTVIQENLMPWQATERFRLIHIPEFDHVDLFNIPPGMASLKMYGGKMHSRRIQDMPFHHTACITPEQRPVVMRYCGNDLETNVDLGEMFKVQMALREEMSAKHGIDLRSKSDAQIAEAVIKTQLTFVPEPKRWPVGSSFYYTPAPYVCFQTEQLQRLHHLLCSVPFMIQGNGSPALPDVIKDLRVTLGGNSYTIGIGGLHSNETTCYHLARDGWKLTDEDVTSYYPETMLRLQLYPEQLGPGFIKIFAKLKADRVAAKAAGNKKDADSLKILINGTFGKLGSPFSILYAPDLMLRVTITGQLALLMLIEAMALNGIECVQANTDGVVLKYREGQDATRRAVNDWWERTTGYTLEFQDYAAIFSRDVNSYIAFKPNGEAKRKGEFAEPVPVASSWPNPECQICVDALVAFLATGKPIEQTVRECTDIRQFIAVRKVTGGAVFEGEELGRVARWYYARNGGKILNTKGHQVANAEGVRLAMELPGAIPTDLDHDYYIIRAKRMALTLGVTL